MKRKHWGILAASAFTLAGGLAVPRFLTGKDAASDEQAPLDTSAFSGQDPAVSAGGMPGAMPAEGAGAALPGALDAAPGSAPVDGGSPTSATAAAGQDPSSRLEQLEGLLRNVQNLAPARAQTDWEALLGGFAQARQLERENQAARRALLDPQATAGADPVAQVALTKAASEPEEKPDDVLRTFVAQARLSAILVSSQGACALIDGQLVRAGAGLQHGIHVERIAARSVRLKWRAETAELTLPSFSSAHAAATAKSGTEAGPSGPVSAAPVAPAAPGASEVKVKGG